MITIPRSVARSCRAFFRRLLPSRSPRRSSQAVGLVAGPDGLRIRCAAGEVAVEHLHPFPAEPCRFTIPLDALEACDGRRGEAFLRSSGGGRIEVVCSDDDKAPVQSFACDGLTAPNFPVGSAAGAVNELRLLAALERAVQTAAKEGARFALHRISLRGRKGEVAATDGSQLLIEGGFTFPWDGDVLVPRAAVFAAPELGGGKAVNVGLSGGWVFFRVGGWTVALKAAEGERFPNLEAAIPSSYLATVWRPGRGEAEALARLLPKLPGGGKAPTPVTVETGRGVVVRARAQDDARPTEVALPLSTVEGKKVQFVIDRTLLERALALGFRSFAVAGPGQPTVCRDGSRTFVCVTIDGKEALPPHPYPVRVSLDGTLRSNGAAVAADGLHPSPKAIPARGLPDLLGLWSRTFGRLAGLVTEQRRRERCG
jgi:hypothetical protein